MQPKLAFSPPAPKTDDVKSSSHTFARIAVQDSFIVLDDDVDEETQEKPVTYRERKPVGKVYHRPDGVSKHHKQLSQKRKEAEANIKSRKPRVHFTTFDAQVTLEYRQANLHADGFQPHQKIICNLKQIVNDALLLNFFEVDNSNLYSYRSNMPEHLRRELSFLHETVFGCRVISHTKMKTKFCCLFLMHYKLGQPVAWASFAQAVHIQNGKTEKTV